MVVIYAIALLGLNILTGFNGQISLGHGAFYAIGAYTTAILLERTGIPYWAHDPDRRCGLSHRRVSVRPAGAAARRPLSGAFDVCPRGRDAAVVEVSCARALDRRRPGHLRLAHLDAPFGLPLAWDQWLYLCRVDVRDRAVRAGAATCCAARPAPPSPLFATIRWRRRAWGSTYRSTNHSPSGSARCTPASPGRWARSSRNSYRPTVFRSFSRSVFLVGSVIGGVASHIGRDIRRIFHRVRSKFRRSDFEGRDLGGLRLIPDRIHVSDADGHCGRIDAPVETHATSAPHLGVVCGAGIRVTD